MPCWYFGAFLSFILYSCVQLSTQEDACLSRPCLNGGQCGDLNSAGYTCTCGPDFTGISCEYELCHATNDCNHPMGAGHCNPNRNYSDPVSLRSIPKCVCAGGYTGSECHVDINECTLRNGNVDCAPFPCIDEVNRHSCNYCVNHNCSANTTCHSDQSTKTFRCGQNNTPTPTLKVTTNTPTPTSRVTDNTTPTPVVDDKTPSEATPTSMVTDNTSSEATPTSMVTAAGPVGEVSGGDEDDNTAMIVGIAVGGVVAVVVIIFIVIIVIKRHRRPQSSYDVTKRPYPETSD